jgi:hypothetical protein
MGLVGFFLVIAALMLGAEGMKALKRYRSIIKNQAAAEAKA